MGTGTNVQKRLVALHHLDAPWKPAEVEQREGRILRQGNENEEVAIYRYVTEGSFDAYMWQALETKARFISPGDDRRARRPPGRGHRRPGAVLRRGEGDRLGQPGRADAGRGRRRVAAAGRPARRTTPTSSTWPAGASASCPETIDRPEGATGGPLGRPGDDRRPCGRPAHHRRQRGPSRRRPGRPRPPPRRPAGGRPRDHALPARHAIAAWPSAWCCIPAVAAEVFLEGATTRHGLLSREHHGPRAVLECPGAAGRIPTNPGATPSGRTWRSPRASSATTRPGSAVPFPHEAYLAELARLRDRLKAGLSAPARRPNVESTHDGRRTRRADQGPEVGACRRCHPEPHVTPSRDDCGGARQRTHPPPGRVGNHASTRHRARTRPRGIEGAASSPAEDHDPHIDVQDGPRPAPGAVYREHARRSNSGSKAQSINMPHIKSN